MDFESPDDLDVRYKRVPTPRKSSESHDVMLSPGREKHKSYGTPHKMEEVMINEDNIKTELDYEEFDVPQSDSEIDEIHSER